MFRQSNSKDAVERIITTELFMLLSITLSRDVEMTQFRCKCHDKYL